MVSHLLWIAFPYDCINRNRGSVVLYLIVGFGIPQDIYHRSCIACPLSFMGGIRLCPEFQYLDAQLISFIFRIYASTSNLALHPL